MRTKKKSLRNRRGGGGPFRAYCRKRMAGRRFASVADAKRGLNTAASSYKAWLASASQEEIVAMQELGRAGTVSHRAGAASFGARSRRSCSSSALMVQGADAGFQQSLLANLQALRSEHMHAGAQAKAAEEELGNAIATWSARHGVGALGALPLPLSPQQPMGFKRLLPIAASSGSIVFPQHIGCPRGLCRTHIAKSFASARHCANLGWTGTRRSRRTSWQHKRRRPAEL